MVNGNVGERGFYQQSFCSGGTSRGPGYRVPYLRMVPEAKAQLLETMGELSVH